MQVQNQCGSRNYSVRLPHWFRKSLL